MAASAGGFQRPNTIRIIRLARLRLWPSGESAQYRGLPHATLGVVVRTRAANLDAIYAPPQGARPASREAGFLPAGTQRKSITIFFLFFLTVTL